MNDKKLLIYLVIGIAIVLIFLYLSRKQKFGNSQIQKQNYSPEGGLQLEPFGEDEYDNVQNVNRTD